jgi:hypothetical protein
MIQATLVFNVCDVVDLKLELYVDSPVLGITCVLTSVGEHAAKGAQFRFLGM